MKPSVWNLLKAETLWLESTEIAHSSRVLLFQYLVAVEEQILYLNRANFAARLFDVTDFACFWVNMISMSSSRSTKMGVEKPRTMSKVLKVIYDT